MTKQQSENSSQFNENDDFIPVNVVTGFLDSGKTKLINSMLAKRCRKLQNILIIQTEQGEEKINTPINCKATIKIIKLSVRELQSDAGLKEYSSQLYEYLKTNMTDEIWIEWNGILPVTMLLTLLDFKEYNKKEDDALCSINKIISIIKADTISTALNATGGAVMDQLINCDIVVIRNVESDGQFKRLRRMLREINPGVKVQNRHCTDAVNRYINSEKLSPVASLYMIIGFCIVFFMLIKLIIGTNNTNYIINIFLGILLQAFPFLLIGILLSSAIQVFVSEKFIENHFPKNRFTGMIFATLSGFCLPVCDCASVPVFRSLVKKGVPVASAVTFMMATPVINPVVILSTWYAFGGNIGIVLCRVIMGIICSIIIGLCFSGTDKNKIQRVESMSSTVCSCGCYIDTRNITSSPHRAKLKMFIDHSKAEFFSVGKFLMIGALVSATLQALGKKIPFTSHSGGLLVSTLILMAMAFLLSLCSSSDAVVAKSFSTSFPIGAVMGFLVFGPMMDIKNIIMLSGSFKKKFVAKLCIVSAVVCCGTVFIAFSTGLGGIIN